MAHLDRTLLRKLAEWHPEDCPITSVYLSVDGRRYPRRLDYEVRLDELLRAVRERAEALEREARRSVEEDVGAIASFVKDRFERGSTRGLAIFSSTRAGLWEDIRLPRPVRNRAVVAREADLLPLEAILETYESFCTVLVDSEKARILVAELGEIEEESHVLDEVPGRHDQGGWSQARFQRHIDEHRQRHLKHVADVLFRFYKRRKFDHLILAGPDEVVASFERELHDYLRRRVLSRIHLPVAATADEVLARSLELEEDLERRRERATVARLAAESAAGTRAVAGLGPTLRALAEGRVGALVVSDDLQVPGVACPRCGRLAEQGRTCEACGAPVEAVPDVVEAAVAHAFRQGARVETVAEAGVLQGLGGIGALLRY